VVKRMTPEKEEAQKRLVRHLLAQYRASQPQQPQRRFTVTYGGCTTTFTKTGPVWQWVTTDASGQRLDGAEADAQAVLYMIWTHLSTGTGVVVTASEVYPT
jgi:hypothetical protein